MGAYSVDDRARWVAEDPALKRADRDDFARDRARLVHSAALRRLSATTQVVQPDTDDFVRNRLTHSLEVAQIGREFARALGCSADVVDTACLAHDLGHPPFGHNGEAALAAVAADIGGFEGNAQTLRILTRLEPKRAHPDGRSAGLNLTRASLDAATKYPWFRGDGPVRTAKFGVYADDADAFAWLRTGAPQRRRCVEAQVMDWADDVAYCVHDVEDAVAGGRLDLRVLGSRTDLRPVFDVVREWYEPDLDDALLVAAVDRLRATGDVVERFDHSRAGLAALKDMTSRLIGRFVLAAEQATLAAFGPGPHTRYDADVVVPAEARAECAVLKALAAHFVMRSPDRVDLMERERGVVADLVAAFLARPERLDVPLAADLAAAQAAGDDAARRRVVLDQVASLSDVRALTLHRRWCT
ncbi:deoxyguanosinetriphosphate triphosphohydrolase [Agilicoccus flavus]|uniref:deoxyguanosinetriphosphate triphosphohydrolase n=1 Tax=Agilicoccus flavus TaxID=2775968 RepID=UPI001CF701C3|nr:deoxyguanosinetriphosphate triphosphohydrolase [Agilicoccus flavus]